MFGDLLGNHGFSSSKRDNGPRTINAMRKEEMAKDMDPDKLKVPYLFAHCLIQVLTAPFLFVHRLQSGLKGSSATFEHYFAHCTRCFGRELRGTMLACTSSCRIQMSKRSTVRPVLLFIRIRM